MALEDLIAQSGGNMARQGIEGWNRGQEMAMQKQEHEMNLKVRDAMLQKTQKDLQSMTDEEDRKKYERKLNDFGYLINGGMEVMKSQSNMKASINQARAYLQSKKQAILDAGTDEDDEAFESLLKMPDDQFFSTYKAMHSSLPLIQDYVMKSRLEGSVGGSEFERLEAIPEAKRSKGQQSRWEVLAALKARPSQRKEVNGYWHEWSEQQQQYVNTGEKTGPQRRAEESLLDAKDSRTKKQTTDLSKQASEDIAKYSSISENIDKAIIALESGDTRVLDQFAQQTFSQTNDTNIRAVQMYKEFGENYGDVLQRTYAGIGQFLTGARGPAEVARMKKDLLEFKEKYAEPTAEKFRNRYRAQAKDKDLDPFVVVPPVNKMEIKNADISNERKLELLKLYFSDEFKK